MSFWGWLILAVLVVGPVSPFLAALAFDIYADLRPEPCPKELQHLRAEARREAAREEAREAERQSRHSDRWRHKQARQDRRAKRRARRRSAAR